MAEEKRRCYNYRDLTLRRAESAGGAFPPENSKEIVMRRLLRELYLMWAALVARHRRLEDGPEWKEWERASLEDMWVGGGL